jgi:uncharacterized protein
MVLNIASTIALVALPFYATYAATKTGRAAFGHAPRRELHGTGVHVATVYLGATASAMMDTSTAGEDLGFGRRRVLEVVTDLLDALGRGEHEINPACPPVERCSGCTPATHSPSTPPSGPRLDELQAAVRHHRSI